MNVPIQLRFRSHFLLKKRAFPDKIIVSLLHHDLCRRSVLAYAKETVHLRLIVVLKNIAQNERFVSGIFDNEEKKRENKVMSYL